MICAYKLFDMVKKQRIVKTQRNQLNLFQISSLIAESAC
jgi:hypothetical protein